jgi:hypothetical protein
MGKKSRANLWFQLHFGLAGCINQEMLHVQQRFQLFGEDKTTLPFSKRDSDDKHGSGSTPPGPERT